MEQMSRREFLARAALAGSVGAATLAAPATVHAADKKSALATVIDLSKCEGCGSCTAACTSKNAHRYPDPVDDIPDNWPLAKHEDWSHDAAATDRLTPYNWQYVEHVEIDGETVHVPRRCMHCDDPACANICPFSAQEKTPEGAVVIDEDTCMGGAKCRDVCPWSIPQRQAGVGVYMDLAPGIVGGGVMYKCDMCADVIAAGGIPACVSACPNGAMSFGGQDEMRELAQKRAEEISGHVYGVDENGGTSTFYVSPVPFEAIDAAITERKESMEQPKRIGVPHMATEVENYLETTEGLVKSIGLAPILGVLGATVAATLSFKKGEVR